MSPSNPGALVTSTEGGPVIRTVGVLVTWDPHPQDDDIVVSAGPDIATLVVEGEVLKAVENSLTFDYQAEEGSAFIVRVESRRGGVYSAPIDFTLTIPTADPVLPTNVNAEIV